MVDDEAHFGVAINDRSARVQIVPAQNVNWKVVADGRVQYSVEAWVLRLAPRFLSTTLALQNCV
jgi:hypothetical protein